MYRDASTYRAKRRNLARHVRRENGSKIPISTFMETFDAATNRIKQIRAAAERARLAELERERVAAAAAAQALAKPKRRRITKPSTKDGSDHHAI
jgi:hypothetical protein